MDSAVTIERRRTVEWEDPNELARQGRGLAGRDFLDRIIDKRVAGAPVAALVGFEPVEVGDGTFVFALDPGEHLYNPLGSVHGGILATLLDSAMGCAVHSALPKGRGYTTLEIKINYVRAVTARTGRVRAEGKVVHIGRRIATAEARLVDAAGSLYAHGTTTCLLFDVSSEG